MGESFIKRLGRAGISSPSTTAEMWIRHMFITLFKDFPDHLPGMGQISPSTQADWVYFLGMSSPSRGTRLAGTSGDRLVQCSSILSRCILSISTSADHPHSSKIIFLCLNRISHVSVGVHHLDITPKTLAPYLILTLSIAFGFLPCKQPVETTLLLSPAEQRIC